MNDIPVTGNPIIDNITKGLLWLSEQTEKVFRPRPHLRYLNQGTCLTWSCIMRFMTSVARC